MTNAKPLPGMAAISLWMLALALIGVLGVLTGHYPPGGARVGILSCARSLPSPDWD